MRDFREFIAKHAHALFPTMGIAYTIDEYIPIDLSTDNPALSNARTGDFTDYESYILTSILEAKARFAYGGYGESRAFYAASPHFRTPGGEPRSVHLGLDVWAPTNFPVHASLPATVHGTGYNDALLDYGSTIILRYSIEDSTFHVLYGHVTYDTVLQYKPGDFIGKGQPFTAVGTVHENGGWYPHLHVQVILDIGNETGNYPGVASEKEASAMLTNCPDPTPFVLSNLQSE